MAIRWVSRYSESLIRIDGSTIAVSDLLERLPLSMSASLESGREIREHKEHTSVFVVKPRALS